MPDPTPLADPAPQPNLAHQRSLIARPLVVRLGYLLAVAAIVVAIVLTRPAGTSASPAPPDIHTTSTGVPVDPPEITVTGAGEVYGTPDTLDVEMDVSAQAAHASSALSQDESQTAALIQTLTGSGVSSSDIQTASLSINPTYGASGDSITGYQVDEAVDVTLHDLRTAGGVVDAAARTVGDAIRIQSMSLSISDSSSLMAQARAQAMADAKTRASQLAAGAGVALGDIVSVTDSSQASPPPSSYGMAVPAASSAVPVQPGTELLSVSVTVVYQLSG